jgi:carbamate kinase
VPLDWCVAQTQATLGFLIVTALEAALRRRGAERLVSTVITRVLVAGDDPAWTRPTKPIGRYVNASEARAGIAAGEAWEARGERGWRRVVASPEPLEILDRGTIEALMAGTVGADCFVVATDVEAAAVGYGSARQEWLGAVAPGRLRDLLAAGEFGSGSMGPKVRAVLAFVEGGGARAAITSLERLRAGVEGVAGTRVASEAVTSAQREAG